MPKRYCAYCGRVAHRCQCHVEDSRLWLFFARNPQKRENYDPRWMLSPYKRAVPPQIKRKERYQLRQHYHTWYTLLAGHYGEKCLNCGRSSPDSKLVLDHIISIARGGLSELDNLQILCAECNRLKGKLCIDCRSDTN